MKKLLLLLFIVPLLSNSQSNNFLTKLFLDSIEIKNQDFKLHLVGVINPSAQEIIKKNDDYYDRYENEGNLTEILFLSEIKIALQRESERNLGNYDESNPDDFKNKCSWNWSGLNQNLLWKPRSLDYFPTFSFLKGKLLTIMDGDSTNKDYLFSVSKSNEYDNYGHKSMHFNLTDDEEKGYTINTIIIEDQAYIILSYSEMGSLGFQTEFDDNSQFKVLCDDDYDGNYYDRTSYATGSSTYYRNEYLKNCKCVCDKNYISVWKTKDAYMEKDYGLKESELYYLFKLAEKN